MRLRLHSLAALPLLALTTISLSGCRDIKMLLDRPSAHLPAYMPVKVVYSGQNWSQQQRQWFYHTSQGSILMPYKWFLALEQPKLLGQVDHFADGEYLARFGFLPNAADSSNPDALPVGFARSTVTDPHTGERVDTVGFTCAACHTGQLNYKGQGIRIDGGTATASLEYFQTELGYAVAFTDKIPWRFNRFAEQVLGPNATSEQKKQLKEQFDAFLKTGLDESQLAAKDNLYVNAGGFGRTDALARIGNYVFGTELDNANLRVATGPVKLPPLWYTSWFSRVQYNSSIQQPMTRNIGEALGVRASVNLTDRARLYQSTVNVKNLWEMENQLAGPTMFGGLQQPAWPSEVFGPIDQQKVHAGAALYKQYCERCHQPALNSAEIRDPARWEDGLEGHKYLKLPVNLLEEIGTDPHEATDFAQRTAVTGPAMGLGTVPAAPGLNTVTVKVRDLIYDQMSLTPEQRIEWNGYRDDNATANLGYRARPLGGIWATPPFLHNGSVPNLYELLVPVSQRSKTFYTGSREFDPVKVGYDTGKLPGGFLFDTASTGNSNAGHEFSNTPGKGVIGPALTDEQRWQLIEYLKSLDDSPQAAASSTSSATKPAAW